jgi:lipoprotein NlpI
MRRIFLAMILLALSGPPALASGYTELNAGIASQKNWQWDDAIKHLSAALSSPDLLPAFRAVAYLDRGMVYVETKRFDLAFADLNASIAADPQNREAYHIRANIHFEREQFAEAIADETHRIALTPYSAAAYLDRAQAYAALNRFDDALADATAAIAILPNSADGYLMRSQVYFEKEDYAQALAEANEGLDRDGHSAHGYYLRGVAYQAAGDYRHSLSDFKDWREIETDSFDANRNVAIAEWELGRFDDAAGELAKIVQHWPDSPYDVLWLALANIKLGRDSVAPVAASVPHLDTKRWPAPLIDLYLGKSTPDAVLKAAAASEARVRNGNLCEANFYAGEWQLPRDAAGGKALIAEAAKSCPRSFYEWAPANAELKRLPPEKP